VPAGRARGGITTSFHEVGDLARKTAQNSPPKLGGAAERSEAGWFLKTNLAVGIWNHPGATARGLSRHPS